MTIKPSFLLCVLLTTLCSSQTYAAQEDPNISFLQQQSRVAAQQKDFDQPNVQLQSSRLLEAGKLPVGEDPCFVIDQLELTFDSQFDTSSFKRLFEPSLKSLVSGDEAVLGKCIGAVGVSYILDVVQNNLLAMGYVTTRVDMPEQDIKATKVLQIKVLPGLIGDVRYGQIPDQAVKLKRESFFSNQSTPALWSTMAIGRGDVLNIRDIETSLENFKRLSSAQVTIDIVPHEKTEDATTDKADQLEPGSEDVQAGYSDLVITWFQLSPVRGSLTLDDAGSSSTGRYQALLSLSLENPLNLADELRVFANTALPKVQSSDTDSLGVNLGYSLPIGKTLVDIGYNRYDFDEALNGLNSDISYRGESEGYNLNFKRLVNRTQFSKTYLSLGGYQKSSKNFIDDEEVEVQRRKTAGWEIGASHSQFLSQGSLGAQLKLRRGTGAFGSLQAPEEEFGEGTSRPTILFYDASYNAPLNLLDNEGSYRLSVSGQYSNDPLIVQDRFYLGGRYTIRGISGSLVGDQGVLVQQDWTWQPSPYPVQTYIGYDFGVVGGASTSGLQESDKQVLSSVLGFQAFIKEFQLHGYMGWGIVTPEYFDQADKRDMGFSLSYGF